MIQKIVRYSCDICHVSVDETEDESTKARKPGQELAPPYPLFHVTLEARGVGHFSALVCSPTCNTQFLLGKFPEGRFGTLG